MPLEPSLICPSDTDVAGRVVTGRKLVIQDWPAEGTATEVAPLHVHRGDDEAWHVISGALRFRFADRVMTAGAGSTVLVPAGVPHTFGNSGPDPSRFLLILPARLDELIAELHNTDREEHAAVYRKYDSEMLS